MLTQLKAARRVSTPLIVIQTPDPASTIATVRDAYKESPVVAWDIVRGVQALTPSGKTAIAGFEPAPEMLTNPIEALSQAAAKLPIKSIIFMHNAQLFIGENMEGRSAVIQAMWNLRDQFKQDGRTLIMLVPAIVLPAEISQDVLILDEPLPDTDALSVIVKECHEAASLPAPAPETLTKAVDALAGLSGFTAEQVTMMSLSRAGLDLSALWERKRRTIEQAPGLSVWRGGEKFSDIGGVANAKKFLKRVLDGNNPPNAVVFIDEIEKALAGAGGDTSGVSQEMLGTLLSHMQDNNWAGIIAIGPPGSAKSMIAKATGSEGNIPTIAFDLSGMKGSLVGESNKNLRQALKVVEAVAQKRVLCIATCNSIGALPPELRRRFKFGTFFFDLPNAEERKTIWSIYLKKLNLQAPLPNDDGWTGAEIYQCCDLAYRLKCSLVEASEYVVPVARSAAEMIERLRMQASGKFISASAPGIYRYEKDAAAPPARRSVDLTMN